MLYCPCAWRSEMCRTFVLFPVPQLSLSWIRTNRMCYTSRQDSSSIQDEVDSILCDQATSPTKKSASYQWIPRCLLDTTLLTTGEMKTCYYSFHHSSYEGVVQRKVWSPTSSGHNFAWTLHNFSDLWFSIIYSHCQEALWHLFYPGIKMDHEKKISTVVMLNAQSAFTMFKRGSLHLPILPI